MAALAMLVGTANAALGADGIIDVKNQEVTSAPGKKSDVDSAYEGDTVTYKVTGKVPATAGKTGKYVFTDYASEGLTIDIRTVQVYIKHDETQVPLTAADFTVSSDVDVPGKGSDSKNDDPTFTVTIPYTALDKYQQYAGEPLVLEYKATLNGKSETNKIENEATVGDGEDESEPGHDIVYSASIKFTKVDKDGTGLTGAKFTIEGVGDTKLSATYPNKTATSDNGAVEFAGLADGTYMITETKAPEGLMEGVTLPSFTVTITNGVITEVTRDDQGLVTWSNGYINIKVMNVASPSELPQTGGAGIVMFVVLGLLIAGAGVTVYMKSRGVRNAMRS